MGNDVVEVLLYGVGYLRRVTQDCTKAEGCGEGRRFRIIRNGSLEGYRFGESIHFTNSIGIQQEVYGKDGHPDDRKHVSL